MLFSPPSSHFLSVPHLQQHYAGECLAACAVMVCAYLGQDLSYRRVVRRLQIERGVGTAFSQIERLDRFGLNITHETDGSLQLLYNLLANGWPVIVSVQASELPQWGQQSMLHAVVVVGMDATGVYLNDPGLPGGPIAVSMGDFDLAWLAQDERYAVLAGST